jgi:stage II sporulation protein D
MHITSGKRPSLAIIASTFVAAFVAGCGPLPNAKAPAPPPHTASAPPTPAPVPNEQVPVPAPVVPPAPIALDGEPSLDIGLAWGLESTRVSFDGSQVLEVQSVDRPGTHSTAGPIDFKISGNQLLVTPNDRPRAVPLLVLHAGDTLWVGGTNWVNADAPRITWNGSHWRGRFKLFMNQNGKLTVATRVTLERYLVGVVPGEIGALNDSLLEAGRAQAVAARSYTLFYRGRRGDQGFDLYATVEDQVYGASESERPLATKCVESTRGLVGLSHGAPIRANYCSTCGGISAEAWEAWPTSGYDYLTSHADAGPNGDHCALSNQFRWHEEWTPREFAANLEKYAPQFGVPLPPGGVGEVRDVRVAERSISGRVWRLDVVTSNGTITVPAYSLRQVLRRGGNPGSILKSNLFKIGVRRDATSMKPVAIVASGAGSGHGVGLCQTGALGMARGGARGEEILAYYYPGATLRRLY